MHERALVADLIRKALEVADAQHTQRVVGMKIRVGALSHVDPATLPRLVVDAAAGTAMEGVRVEVVAGPDDVDDPTAQDVVLETIEVR